MFVEHRKKDRRSAARCSFEYGSAVQNALDTLRQTLEQIVSHGDSTYTATALYLKTCSGLRRCSNDDAAVDDARLSGNCNTSSTITSDSKHPSYMHIFFNSFFINHTEDDQRCIIYKFLVRSNFDVPQAVHACIQTAEFRRSHNIESMILFPSLVPIRGYTERDICAVLQLPYDEGNTDTTALSPPPRLSSSDSLPVQLSNHSGQAAREGDVTRCSACRSCSGCPCHTDGVYERDCEKPTIARHHHHHGVQHDSNEDNTFSCGTLASAFRATPVTKECAHPSPPGSPIPHSHATRDTTRYRQEAESSIVSVNASMHTLHDATHCVVTDFSPTVHDREGGDVSRSFVAAAAAPERKRRSSDKAPQKANSSSVLAAPMPDTTAPGKVPTNFPYYVFTSQNAEQNAYDRPAVVVVSSKSKPRRHSTTKATVSALLPDYTMPMRKHGHGIWGSFVYRATQLLHSATVRARSAVRESTYKCHPRELASTHDLQRSEGGIPAGGATVDRRAQRTEHALRAHVSTTNRSLGRSVEGSICTSYSQIEGIVRSSSSRSGEEKVRYLNKVADETDALQDQCSVAMHNHEPDHASVHDDNEKEDDDAQGKNHNDKDTSASTPPETSKDDGSISGGSSTHPAHVGAAEAFVSRGSAATTITTSSATGASTHSMSRAMLTHALAKPSPSPSPQQRHNMAMNFNALLKPIVSTMHSFIPMSLHYSDKDGNPVMYYRLERLNVRRLMHQLGQMAPIGVEPAALITLFHAYVLETLQQLVRFNNIHHTATQRYAPESATRKLLSSCVVIVDAASTRYHGLLTKPMLRMLRSLIAMSQQHYPEILKHLYVVNCNKIGRVLYLLLRSALSTETRQEITFCASATTPQTLSRVISREVLPRCYGGLCECPGGCIPVWDERDSDAADSDATVTEDADCSSHPALASTPANGLQECVRAVNQFARRIASPSYRPTSSRGSVGGAVPSATAENIVCRVILSPRKRETVVLSLRPRDTIIWEFAVKDDVPVIFSVVFIPATGDGGIMVVVPKERRCKHASRFVSNDFGTAVLKWFNSNYLGRKTYLHVKVCRDPPEDCL